jgi:hypothetical protein
MSWLTANEVFLMEVVARDRGEDLRSSVDLAIARVDGAGETSRDVPEADCARPERSAVGLPMCHRASAARS